MQIYWMSIVFRWRHLAIDNWRLLVSRVRSRGLPVDRARHHERGQPLCMEQYYRLFTSYRFPGLPKDRLLDTHPQDGLAIGANMNNHVIVAHKNQVHLIHWPWSLPPLYRPKYWPKQLAMITYYNIIFKTVAMRVVKTGAILVFRAECHCQPRASQWWQYSHATQTHH